MQYSTTNICQMKREIMRFSGKISASMLRPEQKFFADMQYGMLASKSCLLSEIAHHQFWEGAKQWTKRNFWKWKKSKKSAAAATAKMRSGCALAEGLFMCYAITEGPSATSAINAARRSSRDADPITKSKRNRNRRDSGLQRRYSLLCFLFPSGRSKTYSPGAGVLGSGAECPASALGLFGIAKMHVNWGFPGSRYSACEVVN